ncbi:MAG: hypothetical protein ACPGO3_09880 [Magnetospiraceae bacterium]
MSLLFACSFDAIGGVPNGVGDIRAQTSGFDWSFNATASKWSGGWGALSPDDDRALEFRFPETPNTAGTVLRVGFWGYSTWLPTNNTYESIKFVEIESTDGTRGCYVQLRMEYMDFWARAQQNSQPTLTGAEDGYLDTWNWQQWHWFEFEFTLDSNSATGRIRAWVDGELAIDGNTQTNAYAGTNGIDRLVLNGAQNNGDWYFDDVIVWVDDGVGMTGYQGPMRIDTLVPNGDDTATGMNWQLSTGSNGYALLDESVPGAHGNGDYIFGDDTNPGATNPGNEALFDFEDFSGGVDTVNGGIKGLTLTAYALIDGADTVSGTLYIDSNGTEADGEPFTLTDSAASYLFDDAFDIDPDTSGDWIDAGIDALKAGVKYDS